MSEPPTRPPTRATIAFITETLESWAAFEADAGDLFNCDECRTKRWRHQASGNRADNLLRAKALITEAAP